MINPNNSIAAPSIAALGGEHFMIPAYQRGYRWTQQQVKELLNDLADFKERAASDLRYCLQPIIVRGAQGYREVIDGQQRLTTIHILLSYLQRGMPEPELFSLRYETRPQSVEFLATLAEQTKQSSRKNIDFHFMYSAYEAIQDWFVHEAPVRCIEEDELKSLLLTRCFVIWYQLDESQAAHDVFMRINSGKIPLTNAELVKALFLKSRADEDTEQRQDFTLRQLEIASEWDQMESALQQEEFWYFLNRTAPDQATRIEFILRNLTEKEADSQDPFATFHYFSKLPEMTTVEGVLSQWQQIRRRFEVFAHWFDDRQLYHLVGYLLAIGVSLGEVLQLAHNCTQSTFRSQLRKRIQKELPAIEAIPALSFDSPPDKERIYRVLLLFNVLHYGKHSSQRFPFHRFKQRTTWSLEHIHAQNSKLPHSSTELKKWLKELHKRVAEADMTDVPESIPAGGTMTETTSQLLDALDVAGQQEELTQEQFLALQEEVFDLFGPSDSHSIANLALLSMRDNASLNNGLFEAKREMILKREQQGSFVPLATRNVFLKYYSFPPRHLSSWTKADRSDYVEAIQDKLRNFFVADNDNF
ncbi:DUF262 domain-containing protein [Hymenobacter guriensis]|uniref:DUF262 domain-containing protein n=1 Tax=Hymenobacter guriensis TaxID=2793065 RepID=A0ABS0L1L0_9BACT|nr:DUF262 domain-containing protein [Hymenobacter guriensis]MBG8554000.1 DUF262 domain-containing protein [Hymenobacter guriensis]